MAEIPGSFLETCQCMQCLSTSRDHEGQTLSDCQFWPSEDQYAAGKKNPRSGECRLHRAILAGVPWPVMTQVLQSQETTRSLRFCQQGFPILIGFFSSSSCETLEPALRIYMPRARHLGRGAALTGITRPSCWRF